MQEVVRNNVVLYQPLKALLHYVDECYRAVIIKMSDWGYFWVLE